MPVSAADVLGALRAIPGLAMFRPGCVIETVECLEIALCRGDGPAVLILSTALLTCVRSPADENLSMRGGYVLLEADGPRVATLVASGAELECAVATQELLRVEGIPIAVVSLPCWSLFASQAEAYRETVLGRVARFALGAAGQGWEGWLGSAGRLITPGAGSTDRTADAVAQMIKRSLQGCGTT